MARNRPNPLDDPPAASSSEEQHHEEEEEEEEDDEEVDEVEEEDDDVPNAQPDGSDSDESDEEEEEEDEDEEEEEELKKEEKIHPQPSQLKPLPKNPNSDDEDDDETESDSDTRSPGVSGFTIKKHVATTPASVKPKKPAKPEDRSPELVSLKRPAQGEKDSRPNAKKAKSENGVEEEAKKSGSNRLWNDEDTIAMLEGMISFIEEKKGLDPTSDGSVFHEYVKDKLSVEVSTSQLVDKIRRLKKKYNINADKAENGEDPVFSKPYDHKCFHLSKKIWGGGGIQNKRSSKKKKPVNEIVKPNREIAKDNGNGELVMHRAKEETAVAESNKQDQGKGQGQEGSFSQLYPFLILSLKTSSDSAGGLMSKDGYEVMGGCLRYLEKSKLEELEDLWKKQILAEAEMAMGRSAIVKKQVELVSNWQSRRG